MVTDNQASVKFSHCDNCATQESKNKNTIKCNGGQCENESDCQRLGECILLSQDEKIAPLDGCTNSRPVLNLDLNKESFSFLSKASGEGFFRCFDYLNIMGKSLSECDLTAVIKTALVTKNNYKVEVMETNYKLPQIKFDTLYKNEIGTMLYVQNGQYVKPSGKAGANMRIYLVFSGTPLSKMFAKNDLLSVVKMVYELYEIIPNFKATRTDLKVIDFEKVINLGEALMALIQGNYKGFRKFSGIISGGYIKTTIDENGNITKEKLDHKVNGFTTYLGSRESELYGRLYYEQVKHDRDSNGYELEIKDGKSVKLWGQLICAYNNFEEGMSEKDKNKVLIKMFNSVMVGEGSFSFIDRSKIYGNGSLKHCQILPFWQRFIDRLGEIDDDVNLQYIREKTTLRTTNKWVERQVMASINNDIEANGLEFAMANLEVKLLRYRDSKEDNQLNSKDNLLKRYELQRDGFTAYYTYDEIKEINDKYGIDLSSFMHGQSMSDNIGENETEDMINKLEVKLEKENNINNQDKIYNKQLWETMEKIKYRMGLSKENASRLNKEITMELMGGANNKLNSSSKLRDLFESVPYLLGAIKDSCQTAFLGIIDSFNKEDKAWAWSLVNE